MTRTYHTALERESAAVLEIRVVGRRPDSWIMALVVPDCEMDRFGDAGVLDLLDLASELKVLVARERAA